MSAKWIIDQFEPSDGRLVGNVRADHSAWLRVPGGDGRRSINMHVQFDSYSITPEGARQIVEKIVAGLNT